MVRPLKIIFTLLLALSSGFAFGGPVNINSADAETLAKELKGVGQVKAHAIVEYRETHGAFQSIDALANVKGIGPAIINGNQQNIKLDAAN
jgi:competence protein ComEA